MRVEVRFFSIIRERVGCASETIDVPVGSTVREALAALRERHPSLGQLLEADASLVLIALNREYAQASAALNDGDELALFPPVSGGSGAAPDRGLLLLSGGFDSPVAGSIALAGGHPLDAVHFSMEPFTDDASTRKAIHLAGLLGLDNLTVVRLGPSLAELAKRCDLGSYFVLQKRLMIRVAEALARMSGASYLLTGENLGQVSSQTLVNLGAIDAVAGLPILRPLLGWDKHEIITEARRIGTYETSIGPEVCDVLGPKHPRTGVALERILHEETKVDIEALVRASLANATRVTAFGEARPLSPGPSCPPVPGASSSARRAA